MKKMKKLASLILAVLMVLSMSVAAFAENKEGALNETPHTIVIQNPEKTYIYEAYRVFSGDWYDNKLSNITWGEGVDGDALLTALTAQADFAACESAEEVAAVLMGEGYTNDSAKLEAFAEIAEKHLATCAGRAELDTTAEKKGEKYEYKINVKGDGYYLIKDGKDSEEKDSVGEGEAYTKFMLQVVGSVPVSVNAKVDAPTIDKKITDSTTNDGKTNNASVGDVVNFEVTSKVPAMDGYDKYFFIVTDTLSKGLTFNKNSVEIKIDGTLLTDEDYAITYDEEFDTENDPAKDTKIEIVFKDFVNRRKNDVGKGITITYNATLNKNAVIGVKGNPNTVQLQYSNNPNVENKPDEGNPDKPDPKFPIGETPKSTTYTYVTGVKLTKIDAKTKESLIGAEFKITGGKLNTVLVRTGEYEEAADGNYYALKDGSYTETPPINNPTTEEEQKFNEKYKDTNKKYAKNVKTEIKKTKENVEAQAFVDMDGVLCFEGLGEGEYVIEEITAPNGYNKLKDKLNVNITWKYPEKIDESGADCSWEVKEGSDSSVTYKDGIFTLEVENNAGALLPSTGGIGTTIFYAAGIILMAGAVFFVVRRKKA